MILTRKHLTTLLSAIVGILLIVALLKWSGNYRAQREDIASQPSGEGTESVVPVIRFNQLSYYNGSTTLEFRLEENKWVWTADQNFPLNDSTIQTIFAMLDNLQPLQTTDFPEELEAYDLGASPAATLRASGDEGSISIIFGKETETGGSRYALMNDEEALYILPDALLEPMSVPIYDMMILPKVPSMALTRINFVHIYGKVLDDGSYETYTILTAQRPNLSEGQELSAADITWRSNGANVSDDPQVQDLLNTLATLSIDKCVDYNPSPAAVTHCGFEQPTAILEVDFLSEGGSEQSLKLTVGNQLPDGSGRYVRFGEEDPSLYRLPNATLDALLAIAATGLEN